MAAVGERPGASDLTDVAGQHPILNINAAGLADGKGTAEEEGDAAEGEVAGLDVVDVAGAGAVEDGECGPALHRLAVVFSPLAAIEGWPRGRRAEFR